VNCSITIRILARTLSLGSRIRQTSEMVHCDSFSKYVVDARVFDFGFFLNAPREYKVPQDESLVGTSLKFKFDGVVVDNKQHECKIVGDDDKPSSSKAKSDSTTATEIAEWTAAKKVRFVFVVRWSSCRSFDRRCSSSFVILNPPTSLFYTVVRRPLTTSQSITLCTALRSAPMRARGHRDACLPSGANEACYRQSQHR
jgi:hypothetical protein